MTKSARVYLDWAAATPLLPEAFAAMEPWLLSNFGNPSSIHQEGRAARDAVEAARGSVAAALQVKPEFVTFTGSGTEANNIAILGAIAELHQAGMSYTDMKVITTAIEHPSVLRACEYLKTLGVTVQQVLLKESGVIDLTALRGLVNKKTVLLSTHYINSEIGSIQPTRAIKKILRTAATSALLHIDAAQAPLWCNCQFDSVGADLLTLDAGKCCGPKGVGILVRGRDVKLQPVGYGGGQESGLRPGTEHVAGVAGAAAAVAWAQMGSAWYNRSETVRAVRDVALKQLLQEIPSALLNGADPESGDRVANNINISLTTSATGFDTEFATVVLDTNGFAVSTKSACSAAGGGESLVVKTITGDAARAASTLRITLGPDTTPDQLARFTYTLATHVDKMQRN